jgi:hexosaminidase
MRHAASAAWVPDLGAVVPAPERVAPDARAAFSVTADTAVHAAPGAEAAAGHLAAALHRPAVRPLPAGERARPGPGGQDGGITLLLDGDDGWLGEEGYRLEVASERVTLRARRAAGLFRGVQTLRQLLPLDVEAPAAQPGGWRIPGGQIVDRPRFAYRGAMLDVARHFFGVADVKRYIDEITLYKLNHLHLHLTDDQGWRIEIATWPKLAAYGGIGEVGGGPGGHYTQAQYADLVAYAAERHVTLVPEIDMPGHTGAALASYAELHPDGVAPPRSTGTDVGASTLRVGGAATHRFVRDVIGEVAGLTPGPYVHVGGDEVSALGDAEYAAFIAQAQQAVADHGKTPVGWDAVVVRAAPRPGTVAQYWDTNHDASETVVRAVARAAQQSVKLILSPGNRAYLDMKYHPGTRLGLKWAGYVEVSDAYSWDPGAHLEGVPEAAVLGVEGALWTETARSIADVEHLAFPRLAAIAELGWSPRATHDWEGFARRLAAQAPRWRAMGINFYPSTQVAWL